METYPLSVSPLLKKAINTFRKDLMGKANLHVNLKKTYLHFKCIYSFHIYHPHGLHTYFMNLCTTARVCAYGCLCEIALGAVAPTGRGCPPVSWQSSGSHGNEARDAPAPDLWYSPPPEELRGRVKQNQSLRLHLKFMYMNNLKGAARTAKTEVGQRRSWNHQLLRLTHH